MLHVVLFQPDIPQNTGNIGRMCAITQSRLHLIYPLGFEVTDKHLKRAGMDYWHQLDVHHHADWEAFQSSPHKPDRLWLFSTHGTRSFWDASYAHNDGLLFGRETAGCPPWLHQAVGTQQILKIDQFNHGLRSLNLSTSAGIATYEALRQLRG